ncbi:MAG: ribonuclease H family protein [Clostridium sp.]|nr:ribonuclease H family protein [Prevotella sp.]MCM1429014.1 ribonuclease H family protein [Clostridium sp.]MCM1475456.1 ribonuclease H family protein [Muribaculaceae bacterium]
MTNNKKFYVVWEGRNPGVYDSWEDARDQIENFQGAKYKSFNTPEEAAEAYRRYTHRTDIKELGRLLRNDDRVTKSASLPRSGTPDYFSFPEIDLNGWAVDASCLGNPGVMEYRGVELMTGREIFRVGPFQDATNNIGEFLAIVHALALMGKTGEWHTIYSDSVSGMAWVRNKKVKTTLEETPDNKRLFDVTIRALAWLNTHIYKAKILKWQTNIWGEIPADFGRK